jgi:hypothetical protein
MRILHSLSQPSQPMSKFPWLITPEEFISTCKVTPEDKLHALHATMKSIPFKVRTVLCCWTKIMDIMLEKEKGNSHCHRLHIIALFESDFNQAKRVLISGHLIHHLEDNYLLPNMQYGSRPDRQCHGVVLEKVLCHDVARITHCTSAFLEIDAIGCIGLLWDATMHHIVLQHK